MPLKSCRSLTGELWLKCCCALLIMVFGLELPATATAAPAGPIGSLERQATIAGQASITPVAVFGKDERQAVPQAFAAIGRKVGLLVNRNARSACTAFCVAPNVIATAAHCLLEGAETPRFKQGTQWFVLERAGRRAFSRISGFARNAAQQNVLLGAYKLHTKRPIDAGGDWALVRLARPACTRAELTIGELAPGRMEEEANAGRIFQIGFHHDLGTREISFSAACPVKRSFDEASWNSIVRDFTSIDKLILHRCDTGPQSSGSPIFWDSPEGPVVVGINVGTYGRQDKQGEAAGPVVVIANTGISTLAFKDRVADFAQAEILIEPEAIARLQRYLFAFGLYAGPRDGQYGPLLRGAISAYQRGAGLPETGLPTTPLLQLIEAEAKPEQPTPDGSKSGDVPPLPARRPATRT